jgi:hypothetical protein
LPFCHQCGYNLQLGIEKFCPNCGFNLNNSGQTSENTKSIDIANNKGDVFGTGFAGSGNIIGKGIKYAVNGNVIHIHVTGNISNEQIENLQKIISLSAQIEQQSLDKTTTKSKDLDAKVCIVSLLVLNSC